MNWRSETWDVRSSFALSYNSLPDNERHAFRLLGLLTGPDFAAWPLVALLNFSINSAEHQIERLVDAKLIDVAGPDGTDTIRYRFHDLLAFQRTRRAPRRSH
jgi:hypothetical protein